MKLLLAGLRFQFWQLRRDFDSLQTFVLTPLFTIIFGGIVLSTGHRALLPGAVLGAALLGMWTFCLSAGGSVLEQERWSGTFEALVSTPARLRLVVLGRVTWVIMLALLAVPEAWLVALIIFHQAIRISHVGLFVLAIALTALGLHATAMLFGSLFVLAREGLIFQNALAYPIYLLGGLAFPVTVLPGWLQVISRILYLTWGSDLLRRSLVPAAVTSAGSKLAWLAVTAVLVSVIGQLLFGAVLRRARVQGTLNLV